MSRWEDTRELVTHRSPRRSYQRLQTISSSIASSLPPPTAGLESWTYVEISPARRLVGRGKEMMPEEQDAQEVKVDSVFALPWHVG